MQRTAADMKTERAALSVMAMATQHLVEEATGESLDTTSKAVLQRNMRGMAALLYRHGAKVSQYVAGTEFGFAGGSWCVMHRVQDSIYSKGWALDMLRSCMRVAVSQMPDLALPEAPMRPRRVVDVDAELRRHREEAQGVYHG